MAAAARKKALVLSLTLATFSVDKKVQERRKYGMSDQSVFESEKEEGDFQPTKKRRTKPSARKGINCWLKTYSLGETKRATAQK